MEDKSKNLQVAAGSGQPTVKSVCQAGGESRGKNSKDGEFQGKPSKEPVSRSVFHVNLAKSEPLPHQECLKTLENYANQLAKLSGAGTHIAEAFSVLLSNTPYAEIAGQFHTKAQQIDVITQADVKQLKADSERSWEGIQGRNAAEKDGQKDGEDVSGNEEYTGAEVQIIARSLAQLLHTQLHCFKAAVTQLSMIAQYPSPTESEAPSASSPLATEHSQLQATSIQNSQSDGSEQSSHTKAHHNKSMDSPKKIKKHFASLFSKFGSKAGSPSLDLPSQSAFYVDLEREAGSSSEKKSDLQGADIGKENTNTGQESTKSEPQQQADMPAEQSDAKSCNGHIATQEELDFVINMLSRTSRPPVSMHSIPEVPNSSYMSQSYAQLHYSKPITGHYPSNLNIGGFSSMENHTQPETSHHVPYSNPWQHRQSDGLISEMSLPREAKTNTWPFKPHHKGPVSEMAAMLQMYGAGYETLSSEEGVYPWGPVPQGLRSGSVLRPGGEATLGVPGDAKAWGVMMEGTGLHKAWPPYLNEGAYSGGDLGSKHWSTTADSSSCSDESSSNGEVPWMMMGLDLVNAAKHGRRRHSSGEEAVSTETATNATAVALNKSVESLLDPKSTNTWPPKHPWGNANTLKAPEGSGMGVDGVSSQLGSGLGPGDHGALHNSAIKPPPSHRPLSNQWSDPLAAPHLSVWDPSHGLAVGSGLSRQSFGNLPQGAVPPPEIAVTTTTMQQMGEKTF